MTERRGLKLTCEDAEVRSTRGNSYQDSGVDRKSLQWIQTEHSWQILSLKQLKLSVGTRKPWKFKIYVPVRGPGWSVCIRSDHHASQCVYTLTAHLQSLAHLPTVTTPAIHYLVTPDISTVNLFHWLQAIIYGATLMIYHCDLQCLPSLNSRYPHNKMSKCWYNQLGDFLS